MIIVSDSRSYGDDVDQSSFKVDRITEKSAICSQEKIQTSIETNVFVEWVGFVYLLRSVTLCPDFVENKITIKTVNKRLDSSRYL